MTTRIALTLVALVAVALALAASAAAVPPVHTSFTVSGEEAPILCDNGVVLTETFTFTSRRTTFFDADGLRTRFILQGYYDGVITNQATGEQFLDRNHYTLIADFQARTVTFNGAVYSIRSLDGGPMLILDLGHIVYAMGTQETLEQSAKHPITAAGPGAPLEDAFCAALA